MEELDLDKIVERIKNGEFLSDIATEINSNSHTLFLLISQDKSSYDNLCKLVETYDKKNKRLKNIVKEILKEKEKANLINKIIVEVNTGRKLTDIAKSDYESTSTYSRLLKDSGYVYNKILKAYTHPVFSYVGEYAKTINWMDYEEEIDSLFKALYYEYIPERNEIAEYILCNFEMKEIDLYHKLYDELKDIASNDGFECIEDLVHYILLRFVHNRTKRDNSHEHEIQEMKDVEGFTTDEEIRILEKNDFLYEDEEIEEELMHIYKDYLIKNGASKQDLESLGCWDLFRIFHDLVDNK